MTCDWDIPCPFCHGLAWYIAMPHIPEWQPIHMCTICGADRQPDGLWYRLHSDIGLNMTKPESIGNQWDVRYIDQRA